MARIGSFQGPQTPFGIPTNTIHPSDNDITPDPAKAESEALRAEQEALFEDIKNQLRNPNAGKAQVQPS